MADDRYSLAEARAIIDAEKCEKGDAGNWCNTHQYAWPTGDECKARPEVADVAAQLLATVEQVQCLADHPDRHSCVDAGELLAAINGEEETE